MDPKQIPFNALIVGPTASGKTRYLVDQLRGPFRGKFDYIVLLCPTFVHNKTYDDFGLGDERVFVLMPGTTEIDGLLRFVSIVFEGTNTLIILDDCAASKDVKKRSDQLVNLAFSARHIGISVWVITQQLTSITKPFRENIAALIVFYTPSKADLKAILHDYGAELSEEQMRDYMKALKKTKYSRLEFSLRHPYSTDMCGGDTPSS